MADVTVKIRNSDYQFLGEVAQYTGLQATLNDNDIGSWSLDVPAGPQDEDLVLLLTPDLNPGGGITIFMDDRIFFSGPFLKHTWKLDPGSGFPVLTVAGTCDNRALATRILFPSPELPDFTDSAQYLQIDATDTETIMRDLVAFNLDQTAPQAIRRMPHLTQNTNGHHGKVQVSPNYRFDLLIEELQKLSQLAPADSAIDVDGNITPGDETQTLGFRIVQVGNALQFKVFPRVVKPNARFSFDLGTLESAEWDDTAPSATYAVVGVGGQTDDVSGKNIAAQLYSYARADARYPLRQEIYVDGGSLNESDTGGQDKIDQVGVKALGDAAGQVSASIVPADTDHLTYGIDYDLGDYVSVELPQRTFTSPIRSVALTADSSGAPRIELGIGTDSGAYSSKSTGTPAAVRQIRAVVRKILAVS